MNKNTLIILGIVALVYFFVIKKDKPTPTSTGTPTPPGAQTATKSKSKLTPEQKAKLAEILKTSRRGLTMKRIQEIKNKVRTPEEKSLIATLESEIANSQTA